MQLFIIYAGPHRRLVVLRVVKVLDISFPSVISRLRAADTH